MQRTSKSSDDVLSCVQVSVTNSKLIKIASQSVIVYGKNLTIGSTWLSVLSNVVNRSTPSVDSVAKCFPWWMTITYAALLFILSSTVCTYRSHLWIIIQFYATFTLCNFDMLKGFRIVFFRSSVRSSWWSDVLFTLIYYLHIWIVFMYMLIKYHTRELWHSILTTGQVCIVYNRL